MADEEVLWMGGDGARRVVRTGWGIQAQYLVGDGNLERLEPGSWDGAVGDTEQDIYEACIEALHRRIRELESS